MLVFTIENFLFEVLEQILQILFFNWIKDGFEDGLCGKDSIRTLVGTLAMHVPATGELFACLCLEALHTHLVDIL